MRRQAILVLAMVAIWFFLTDTGFAEILPYEIIDLGSLGGGYAVAYGINDSGQVVGISNSHAFLWDDGEMLDLGMLPGPGYSEAYSINDTGQVVGYSGSDAGSAFIWDSSGGMRYLDGIGDTESIARCINNSGQVVGYVYGYPGFGYLWDSTNGVTDLELFSAWGINDAGQVVGSSYSHAFLWEDGEMTDLGFEGIAYAINEAGQVVGWSYTASGGGQAFLWDDGEMLDLGTFGGPYSYAYGINDAGQIVGYSYLDPAIGGYRGFLWDSDNGMIELSDLLFDSSGWERLRFANDINNYGQIVGQGVTVGGEYHAFLMTPIPEPATLLLVGLGAITVFRRRRKA